MDLATLTNMVITEVNRPDMGLVSNGGDGRIPQAIIASTLKMHGLDFFYKDIRESMVVFDQSAYIQQLDIQSLPRFKALAYARKNDPSLASYQQNPTLLPPLYTFNSSSGIPESTKLTMKELEIITPDAILDVYGSEKFDVCYAAGGTVNIKSTTSLQYLLLGYYAWPDVGQGTVVEGGSGVAPVTGLGTRYYSWIADEFPFAIVYDAASTILQKIGMTDAARKYDSPDPEESGLVKAHKDALLRSNIVLKGY